MSCDFAICLEHRAGLHAQALQITRNRDDALDLVQQTYLKAWTKWSTFSAGENNPSDAASAWLHEILRNTFINGYRAVARRRVFAESHHGDMLVGLHGSREDTAPAHDPAAEELSDELTAALAELEPSRRDTVERVYLRGELYRAVAARRGLPIGTVMSSLSRARAQLAERLADFAAREYGITDKRPARDPLPRCYERRMYVTRHPALDAEQQGASL